MYFIHKKRKPTTFACILIYLSAIFFFLNGVSVIFQALGYQDFTDGPDVLLSYLENTTYPTVCANCDLSKMPELSKQIKPFHIEEIGGKKIGIMGYLSPRAKVVYCGKECVGSY